MTDYFTEALNSVLLKKDAELARPNENKPAGKDWFNIAREDIKKRDQENLQYLFDLSRDGVDSNIILSEARKNNLLYRKGTATAVEAILKGQPDYDSVKETFHKAFGEEMAKKNFLLEGAFKGTGDLLGLPVRAVDVVAGTDYADEINRINNAVGAESEKARSGIGSTASSVVENIIPLIAGGQISKGLSAVKKLMKVAKYAPYAVNALIAGNQAITNGKDAGLSDGEIATYAGSQAASEFIFGAIFQGLANKFPKMQWLAGTEGSVLNPEAFRESMSKGLKEALAHFGKNQLAELTEEQLTSFTQLAIDKLSGVDPSKWSLEQVGHVAYETGIQTLALGTTMHGVNVASSPETMGIVKEKGRDYFLNKQTKAQAEGEVKMLKDDISAWSFEEDMEKSGNVPTEQEYNEMMKEPAVPEEKTADIANAKAEHENEYDLITQDPANMSPEQLVDYAKKLQSIALKGRKDELTSLPNQNVLKRKMLSGEIPEKQRALMFDIDKFKAINDTYGHASGDQVLTDLGKIITEVFPDKINSELGGRFGGEEFLVFLNDDMSDDVRAEKLLNRVAKELKVIDQKTGEKHPVTISMGISQGKNAADDALYLSKNNGRNRLTVDNNGKLEYIEGIETGEKPYVKSSIQTKNNGRSKENLRPEEMGVTEGIRTGAEAPSSEVRDTTSGTVQGIEDQNQPKAKPPQKPQVDIFTGKPVVEKATKPSFDDVHKKITPNMKKAVSGFKGFDQEAAEAAFMEKAWEAYENWTPEKNVNLESYMVAAGKNGVAGYANEIKKGSKNPVDAEGIEIAEDHKNDQIIKNIEKAKGKLKPSKNLTVEDKKEIVDLVSELGNIAEVHRRTGRSIDTINSVMNEMKDSLGEGYHDLYMPSKALGQVAKDGRIMPAALPPLQSSKPKKLKDIVLSLGQAFDKYMSKGRTGRRALGYYSSDTGAIVLKHESDISVAIHEVSHWLDDEYQVSLTGNDSIINEMLSFSKFSSSPNASRDTKIAEGFAEFLRAYTINPDLTNKQVPRLVEHALNKIPADIMNKLQAWGRDVRRWYGADERDQGLSHIYMWNEKFPILKKIKEVFSSSDDNSFFSLNFGERLFKNFADDEFGIWKAKREILDRVGKNSEDLKPSEDPFYLIRNAKGHADKIFDVWENGMRTAKGKKISRTSYEDLVKYFDKSSPEAFKKDMEDTSLYMVAQHVVAKTEFLQKQATEEAVDKAVELSKKGFVDEAIEQLGLDKKKIMQIGERMTGMGGGFYSDVDFSKRILESFNKDQERLNRVIRPSAVQYRRLADYGLKYLMDKGVIKLDEFVKIKQSNVNYVALNRVIDDLESSTGIKKGDNSKGIDLFKGSTRMINNPYANLYSNLGRMISAADINEAKRSFVNLSHTGRGFQEGDTIDISDIIRESKGPDSQTISVFINGKLKHYWVQEDIYQGFQGFHLDAAMPEDIKRWYSLYARALRAGVTLSPSFIARNIFRDYGQRKIVSKHGGSPLDIFGKPTKGELSDWRWFGGGQAGFYTKENTDFIRQIEGKIRELTNDKKTILMHPGDLWEGYKEIAAKSETVNRLAEYRNALKHAKEKLGYDDFDANIYAAFNSRDMLDYAVTGRFIRFIKPVIPFLNANIQGAVKSARAFKANKIKTTANLVKYGIMPRLIVYSLAAAMGDEVLEEYRKLPSWRRDFFYNIKISKNTWLTIPTAFDFGVMSSTFERALDNALGNDKAFDDHWGNYLQAASPVDLATLIMPLKPLGEILLNENTFTDRPIIPYYEEKLPVEKRKGAGHASALAQGLQAITTFDARNIDHMIYGMFGTSGRHGAQAIDMFIEKGKSKDTSAVDFAKNLSGMFGSSPAYSSTDVQWILDEADRRGMSRSAQIRPLRDLLKRQRAATTAEEKDRLAKQVRGMAKRLRKGMEK